MTMRRLTFGSITVLVLASGCAAAPSSSSQEDQEGTHATESAVVTVPKRYRQQAVPDFNGDHYADCAYVNPATGAFNIHLNQKNGTFSTTQWGHGANVNSLVDLETLVGDFTGDGLADFADHVVSNSGSVGTMSIYRAAGSGAFTTTSTWGAASTTIGSNWETLVGDFTGDGFADYADHNLSNGGFYIHENQRNGGFASWGVNWGSGQTNYGNNWETLVADFTGDRFVDFADHNLTTGEFWIHENLKNGTFADPSTLNRAWGYGKSNVTTPFATLVGDFTGDGYADYIDYNTTTGDFWIHQNLKNGAFDGYGHNWGSGNCYRWLGYVGPYTGTF